MMKMGINATQGGFELSYKSALLLFWVGVACCALAIWGGYQFAYWKLAHNHGSLLGEWQQYLQKDHHQLQTLEHQTTQRLQMLMQRLGRVESNVLRINALGEKLVEYAHLNPVEFNFQHDPKLAEVTSLPATLQRLDALLEKRYTQLNVAQMALAARLGQREVSLVGPGSPIVNGWISSFFGPRSDPFTGRQAWHSGVDIAGKEGTSVRAMAAGIVSFADDKGGYGRFVEINHGNGLTTRYGHNKALLVSVGQLVKKGQTIALVGSSGRSTGPHVHLEVRKNGTAVDPGRYFADLRHR